MEKKKPLFTAGGTVNWHSHYGKQSGGSPKIKNRVTTVAQLVDHHPTKQKFANLTLVQGTCLDCSSSPRSGSI